MFDVEHDRVGVSVPPRRRLHARGEAAVRDLVFSRADLLDDFADEIHVGVLVRVAMGIAIAPGRRLTGGLIVAMPDGGVEDAELRFVVELGAVGGDAVRSSATAHVAACDDR